MLVAGLRDGSADLDGDGDITLDELYSYVYERVVEELPRQRPKKQDNVEGRTVIARNINWSLPGYIRSALASPIAADRRGALDSLTHLHRIGNDLVRQRVRAEVERLVDDDSRAVSAAASAWLSELGPSSSPAGESDGAADPRLPPPGPDGAEPSDSCEVVVVATTAPVPIGPPLTAPRPWFVEPPVSSGTPAADPPPADPSVSRPHVNAEHPPLEPTRPDHRGESAALRSVMSTDRTPPGVTAERRLHLLLRVSCGFFSLLVAWMLTIIMDSASTKAPGFIGAGVLCIGAIATWLDRKPLLGPGILLGSTGCVLALGTYAFKAAATPPGRRWPSGCCTPPHWGCAVLVVRGDPEAGWVFRLPREPRAIVGLSLGMLMPVSLTLAFPGLSFMALFLSIAGVVPAVLVTFSQARFRGAILVGWAGGMISWWFLLDHFGPPAWRFALIGCAIGAWLWPPCRRSARCDIAIDWGPSRPQIDLEAVAITGW